jgi:hypothetical protein
LIGWKVWRPAEPAPKPKKVKRRLSQPRLAIALREAVDEAMILGPDFRRNRSALRRLRLLLDEYPAALSHTHVVHNLGAKRMAWLQGMGHAADDGEEV